MSSICYDAAFTIEHILLDCVDFADPPMTSCRNSSKTVYIDLCNRFVMPYVRPVFAALLSSRYTDKYCDISYC